MRFCKPWTKKRNPECFYFRSFGDRLQKRHCTILMLLNPEFHFSEAQHFLFHKFISQKNSNMHEMFVIPPVGLSRTRSRNPGLYR